MSISTVQMRWMGACALLAGGTMVGARLVQMFSNSPSSGPGALALPVSALAIAGVLGLYARYRTLNRSSATGLALMLVGWAGIAISTIAFMVVGRPSFFLWYVLNTVGWLVLIPVAFVLLGVGLPRPSGRRRWERARLLPAVGESMVRPAASGPERTYET